MDHRFLALAAGVREHLKRLLHFFQIANLLLDFLDFRVGLMSHIRAGGPRVGIQLQEPFNLLECKSQVLRALDKPDPLGVLLGVLPEALFHRGPLDESSPLVEANRFNPDARGAGQFPDREFFHEEIIHSGPRYGVKCFL